MHASAGSLLILSSVLVAGHHLPNVVAARDYPQHSSCKSVPGSASWPSVESWNKLNESTGGRLLRPAPPGAVCHPGQPTYDAAKCPGVTAAWSTHEFHQADPVSSMYNQYNNDTCLPEQSDPCSGEGYPVFVINATSPEHVKLGVDFARQHNVRLIVKSSGHDMLGRSSAPNSLSIWTHHMKGMTYHKSFSPSRCNVKIDGGAVTAAGGTQMEELYEFTDKYNETVVGGTGPTVSVGGYLTGGGHSLLSARYGLGTDQVLEMQIVTPQGEILTINECSHTDLFWAMRGGGGSTFGILTSVTVKTHPTPKIVAGIAAIVTPATSQASIDTGLDLAAYALSKFPSLGDGGLSGYAFVLQSLSNPASGDPTKYAGIAATVALQDTQDPEDLKKLWNPIYEYANATWPNQFGYLVNTTIHVSYWDWFQSHKDMSATGDNSYVGSRLLDGPALTTNTTATREAFRQFSSASGVGTAYLVSGKGVWNAKPRGGSNAVLPAWRKAYVHATNGIDFQPLDPAARADAVKKTIYTVEGLRKLAPNSGAYMNEANPNEPDWQHQFWGANYDRLLSIKRAVDPDDVLWCTPCVGNERWKVVDDQLCRV